MKVLVSDALWCRVEPLLPPAPRRRFRFPGRKPLDRRRIFTGILYVLKTGIAWDDLPTELGWGCGKTCRHDLRLWHAAGIWQQLHALLLAEVNAADLLDWSRAIIDGTFAKAPEGGEETGPNPTGRSKSGSKHHVLTDANGIPLAATLTAADVPDVVPVMGVPTAMPPVGGTPGPEREKPDRLQGDRGYDSNPRRKLLRWPGIVPELAARNTGHGSGMGKTRWVVERTNAFRHAFGRLRRRLDRRAAFQHAFLAIACSLICIRFLEP